MSFIRHKIIGNKSYAYEITSIWDKESKKTRSRYLGPVDQQTKEIKKFSKKVSLGKEKLILDFGYSYFLNQFVISSDLYIALKEVFFDHYSEMITFSSMRIMRNLHWKIVLIAH